MISNELVKTKFCFPDTSFNTKEGFIEALIQDIDENQKNKCAGFDKKEQLKEALGHKYNEENIRDYKPLTTSEKKHIEKLIIQSFSSCNKTLSINKTLYVFVFPWFSSKGFEVFNGSIGFAPANQVVHLFVDVGKFTDKAIKDSVVHEYNHLSYFEHHKLTYTILEGMILEGLAENYREELLEDSSKPWSIALTKNEAKKKLEELQPLLNTSDYYLYQKIFFGNNDYKRWTGYSIGYHVVKNFRKINPRTPWNKIISMTPEEILRESNFK